MQTINPMSETKSDNELKQLLENMLPEILETWEAGERSSLLWRKEDGRQVKNTELLALCRMVELTLDDKERRDYAAELWSTVCRYAKDNLKYLNLDHSFCVSAASWQQRTTALAAVKGIK